MSILAANLKTIRKELKCTQSVMGDILKVGFRTYVRYEAGERDAPVAILVKITRLGNISLERLLTKELGRNDVVVVKEIPKNPAVASVKKVDFVEGQVDFRKPARQELLTTDDWERRLLTLFRKMNPDLQKTAAASVGKSPQRDRPKKKATAKKKVVTKKKAATKKKASRPKKVVGKAALKKSAVKKTKKKGRPGRKKLDKKLLKEKIDKLKMITGSIQKTTVR